MPLALAYLGTLAFAAFCLWLRRSTVGAQHAAALAEVRAALAVKDATLAERIRALELKQEAAEIGRGLRGG